MSRILIYGASGHGKVVADAARLAGHEVLGFVDDDPSKRGLRLLGLEVRAVGLDEIEALCRREGLALAPGVGSNRARLEICEAAWARGLEIAGVVHPSAVLAATAALGRGVVVFAGVVVNPDSIVEDGVILNTACSVDHDNRIGRFAHLSPGVRLGGTVSVGEGTHVGIGASVRNNVTLGAWSIVGAGAAVVGDLPAGVVAFGVPARVQRKVSP
jgi:sugar O-acyltransferase (sialic acid O-acetyltransferase NeuD family)